MRLWVKKKLKLRSLAIQEGKVRKGGVNERPSCPRPEVAPPQGMPVQREKIVVEVEMK